VRALTEAGEAFSTLARRRTGPSRIPLDFDGRPTVLLGRAVSGRLESVPGLDFPLLPVVVVKLFASRNTGFSLSM
jgi:hypothetical protein